MDVLVTGADTDLGRLVAEEFRRDGHRVVVAGADADPVVCDPADPASLVQAVLPSDLDAVVIVPVPAWTDGDPRTFTLTETAVVWRSAFDRTVVSAVLTVQAVGDRLRSGGSIVCVVPGGDGGDRGRGAESGADIASKAALSAWTAAQADHFGARGITINTVAPGRPTQPGYPGLEAAPPAAADEIARLAVFLATPAAWHITGQTLHVGRGAAVTYR
jgi:hypothetical protein